MIVAGGAFTATGPDTIRTWQSKKTLINVAF